MRMNRRNANTHNIRKWVRSEAAPYIVVVACWCVLVLSRAACTHLHRAAALFGRVIFRAIVHANPELCI